MTGKDVLNSIVYGPWEARGLSRSIWGYLEDSNMNNYWTLNAGFHRPDFCYLFYKQKGRKEKGNKAQWNYWDTEKFAALYELAYIACAEFRKKTVGAVRPTSCICWWTDWNKTRTSFELYISIFLWFCHDFIVIFLYDFRLNYFFSIAFLYCRVGKELQGDPKKRGHSVI